MTERSIPEPRTDWPGRWLGGMVGAVASLVAAAVLFAVERPLIDRDPAIVGGPSYAIALTGVPIAFALGRAAFPSIRSGGWRWALCAGFLLGLAAPPLGAVELVFGPLLLPLAPDKGDQLGLILLLPIALVFSYAVVWITIPVGLVTGLGIRAIPSRLLPRLRAPEPLAALGIRHAIVALAAWAVAVQIVSAVARS